jgi:hypothetical protein
MANSSFVKVRPLRRGDIGRWLTVQYDDCTTDALFMGYRGEGRREVELYDPDTGNRNTLPVGRVLRIGNFALPSY